MASRNPAAIPADTSEEMWRLQMAAIARRTADERLGEWVALSRAVARMADGICHRHPDYDDRRVLLAAARLRYGDDVVVAAWPNDPLYAP